MKTTNIVAIVLALIITGVVGFNVYRSIGHGNAIEFDSHTLTNNLWGKPPEEILTSGVYLNQDNTYGWYWDRPDPLKNPGDRFTRPIFLNVRIGADFGERSNSDLFPLKAGDIRSLNFYVDYHYPTPPTGAYNLAYQMYFTDTDRPGPDEVPVVEAMIWLHNTFPQPDGTHQADYSDGKNSYGLYSWVMTDGRRYASFIMKEQATFDAQHGVDAKKLLDNLSIDPKLYLQGVHFGSEIVSGAGKLEVRKLTITLNGKQI